MSNKSFIIDDDVIKEVWICQQYHFMRRWDVLPFIGFYLILLTMAHSSEQYQYLCMALIPILLISQILLFFMSRWSVLVSFYIGYKRVQNISNADHVIAFSAKSDGGKIAKLFRRPEATLREVAIAGKKFGYCCEFFEYDKVKYEYDTGANCFSRVKYPTQVGVSQVMAASGHASEEAVNFCISKWGLNFFDIPIPLFLDLYVEHVCAPFFVFQVLCLFLWSMDDYWYYSMFTLFMLLFFEGMLCKQRQNSLFMLRNMRRPPQQVVCLRCGHWLQISSDELVPGDIIILTSYEALNGSTETQNESVVPCDGLLLSGTCVVNEAMLTGESVPQVKEALTSDVSQGTVLDIGTEFNSEAGAMWKSHVVLGGTTVLQHAAGEKLPISGCKVLVLRTGFGTTQGMLMRKILFAANRNTKQSLETFYFIGILVVFAIMASATVLYHGYSDENRNKFKLFLHCIMIITSVIPPELPMELSLAVTTSLAALSKMLVYCTEPDRIEIAGKVSVMCFDKTGTLTKDRMMLDGLLCNQDKPVLLCAEPTPIPPSDPTEMIKVEDIKAHASLAARIVMASCHSLTIQGKATHTYVGDPLEVAAFTASGLYFDTAGPTIQALTLPSFVSPKCNVRVQTLQRYPFNSTLKRMSVLVEVSKLANIHHDSAAAMVYGGSSSGAGSHASTIPTPRQWLVVTKGAPEVLAPKLKKLPDQYNTISGMYMARGKRVLAIACKLVSEVEAKGSASSSSGSRSSSSANYVYPRDLAERDLDFCGFLVFDCELKSDSKGVIRELIQSAHRVMMITGDNPLTAIDVADRLDMMKKGKATLLYHPLTTGAQSKQPQLQWKKASSPGAEDEEVKICGLNEVAKLGDDFNLCITGDGIQHLIDVVSRGDLGSVDAGSGRSTSSSGSAVATGRQSTRQRIGAVLKHVIPYVTIFSRVTPVQKETIISTLNDCGHFTLMCGDGTNDVGALKAAHIGVSIVNNPDFETNIENALKAKQAQSSGSSGATKTTAKDKRVARAVAELNAQFEDHSVIKLGDASIASPFTSRRTSIDSVLSVLRQGRATLVTTIQIFKILALNCLISAYFMSTLYLRGLKQGDTQMTVSGLASALLFFFLSQSKPLQRIDAAKPQTSVFQKSVVVSVMGQFIVHLTCLVTTLRLCESHLNQDDPSLAVDGRFQPNIINTAMYLLGLSMLINNFVVNYCGHPFVQSISDNTLLWRSIIGLYACIVIVVGGQLEPLNDFLQLTPFPSAEFQAALLGILVFNFAGSYAIEHSARKYL